MEEYNKNGGPMLTFCLLQKGTPDIINLILVLLGLLTLALILNSLYEWLMRTPWKKPKIQEPKITDENSNEPIA